MFLAAAGYLAAGLTSSVLVALVALVVVRMGQSALIGPFYGFASSILEGPAAAAAIAFISTVGNVGGIVGPLLMGALKDATGGYTAGMIALSLILFSCATCLAMVGNLLSSPATAPMRQAPEAV